MTVWVRYTTPTLGRLLDHVSAVTRAEPGCYPDVVDDDIADFVFDVGSEDEGVEIVSALRQRLGDDDDLQIVRATYFQKGPVL